MLSPEQKARIRFAYRVWSTGNTYGAPVAAVRAANWLIDDIHDVCVPTSRKEFTEVAKEIIIELEN